jgi:hypothetical protein
MKKLLSLLAASALGLGLAGCGEEPVPDYPSYSLQVKPLLVARCVRCHSAAGLAGMDSDPYSPPLEGKMREKPTTSGFDVYETAKPLAAIIKMYLELMPPPPSPPLTDREKEILARWTANPLP